MHEEEKNNTEAILNFQAMTETSDSATAGQYLTAHQWDVSVCLFSPFPDCIRKQQQPKIESSAAVYDRSNRKANRTNERANLYPNGRI